MADRYLTIDEFLAEAEQRNCPISYRTLRYYASLGLLPSATMLKDKSGRAKGHYPATGLLKLEIIFALQKRGLSLQQIEGVFTHILSDCPDEAHQEKLEHWLRNICQGGMLPMLYELSPLMGDTLREQVANMLLTSNLEPIASELRDIRLTATTRTGQNFSRYFFIAEEKLEIANIFFWDLAGLAELLSAAAYQREGWHATSLPQVRTWLHGRSNWAPQDFLMAKYEGKPVACVGLHRPWNLRLLGKAEIFGPIVHPEFRHLSIGDKLLTRVTSYALGLGIKQLLLPVPGGKLEELDLNELTIERFGTKVKMHGFDYSLRTATLPTSTSRIVPLSGDPGRRYLHELLRPEPQQETAAAQAIADATMPGWVAITPDGVAAAISWLNTLDRQLLLAYSDTATEDELTGVLSKSLDTARLKGMQAVTCFIPDKLQGEWLDKFGVQARYEQQIYEIATAKPGH